MDVIDRLSEYLKWTQAKKEPERYTASDALKEAEQEKGRKVVVDIPKSTQPIQETQQGRTDSGSEFLSPGELEKTVITHKDEKHRLREIKKYQWNLVKAVPKEEVDAAVRQQNERGSEEKKQDKAA